MSKQKITLTGMSGQHHATGKVDQDKIRVCGNLIRNGRHYAFDRISDGIPVFRETPAPWDITAELECDE